MKVFTKDNVILGLVILVSVFATLFYRERQVAVLTDKIVKTESLLKNVNWAENSRKYLLRLGYNIPEPKPVPVVEEEKKDEKEKKK